jgi:hypothetical protein
MPQHQALQFAIFSQETHSCLDGVAGRPDVEHLAIKPNFSGVSRVSPKHQPDRLGATRPN